MSSKELYCYRILKSYSLIVDFDGEVARANVPTAVEGETFKKWKARVLGDNVNNVVVYAPSIPAPNQKIHTLQNNAQANHLVQVFSALDKEQRIKKKVAVQDAKQETVRQLSTISKDTLEDILAEAECELEPSVKEFFDRFQDSTADDIEVETLLKALVNTFNMSVRIARHKP